MSSSGFISSCSSVTQITAEQAQRYNLQQNNGKKNFILKQ